MRPMDEETLTLPLDLARALPEAELRERFWLIVQDLHGSWRQGAARQLSEGHTHDDARRHPCAVEAQPTGSIRTGIGSRVSRRPTAIEGSAYREELYRWPPK
jgi:hypothetical protein